MFSVRCGHRLNTGDVVEVFAFGKCAGASGMGKRCSDRAARESAIRRAHQEKCNMTSMSLSAGPIAESVFTGAHLQFFTQGASAPALKNSTRKLFEDVLVSVGRGDLPVSDLIEAVYPGASVESAGEILAGSLREF